MIDWTRLNDLRVEIGHDDLTEVVAAFLEETDEVMARLTNGETGGLEQSLHFLKGSALNLGLTAFAILCEEGEIRAAAGQDRKVDLGALSRIYEASKSTFLSALSKLGAA